MKLLHAVLMLTVAVLLARVLGPSQFGVYTFAFAVVTVLAIPIQFGLPLLVVRETAAGRARADASSVQGIWRWSLRFILLGSGLVLVVGGLLLATGWTRLDSAFRWTFLWALPLTPLIALAALHGAALRGHDRVVVGQLPEHIIRLAFFAVLISGYVGLAASLNAPRAMAMHLAAAIFALLTAHLLLRRVYPAINHTLRVDKVRAQSWLLSILPLGFIAAAQIINTRADILMLGVLTDVGSVGIYQVAVQGAQAVAMTLAAFSLVVAPRIAALHEKKQNDQLQKMVTLSGQIVLFVTIPIVLILMVFGGWLIQLIFGCEYQSAYLPLAILAVGQLINAGFGVIGVLLNMTGHERATAWGLSVAAGLNILLNLVLIPYLGIVGAAIATALSLSAWNVLLWRSGIKLLGINSLAFCRMRNRTQRM